MPLPAPIPGLVIRYSYLWKREADQGREDGRKDRPCAILLTNQSRDDRIVVTVLPVTHSPPADDTIAVEIPSDTKRRLGLDSERSWVILSELNRFFWPGPDLRRAHPGDEDSIAYGELPANFFRHIRRLWLAAYDRGAVRTVNRTS